MFRFSRKLDYAILAVSHLSTREKGDPVSARLLAERTRIPTAILANILKDLGRAGIVESVRGVHGGYELAALPAEISVGQVIEALEGRVRLVECVVLPGENPDATSGCTIESDCPVKAPLRRVHERVYGLLHEMTFEELVADPFAALSDGPSRRGTAAR